MTPAFSHFWMSRRTLSIRNAMLDKLDQPSVVDGIEEPTDIGIEHPVHLLLRNSDRQSIERIVRLRPGRKPYEKPRKSSS